MRSRSVARGAPTGGPTLNDVMPRETKLQRPPSGLLVGVMVMIVAATVAVHLIWFVALPTGPEACNLTYPGPRICFVSDRAEAAFASTVVFALVCVFALFTTVALSRRHAGVVSAGIVVVIVAGIVAYVSVAWIPALA